MSGRSGNPDTIRAKNRARGQRALHQWHDTDGAWRDRAGWGTRAEAVAASEHIERLTNRPYWAYGCPCGQLAHPPVVGSPAPPRSEECVTETTCARCGVVILPGAPRVECYKPPARTWEWVDLPIYHPGCWAVEQRQSTTTPEPV